MSLKEIGKAIDVLNRARPGKVPPEEVIAAEVIAMPPPASSPSRFWRKVPCWPIRSEAAIASVISGGIGFNGGLDLGLMTALTGLNGLITGDVFARFGRAPVGAPVVVSPRLRARRTLHK